MRLINSTVRLGVSLRRNQIICRETITDLISYGILTVS